METNKNIYEKLSLIQVELKAPKNQYNSFGKYKYRNCEDILESAKPICNKNRTTLTIHDDIVVKGERYYVEATATLFDWDSNNEITVRALAREEDSKKGMDASQVTGATSSYARKYALNGLFNIDDTKDTDTEEHQSQKKASEQQVEQAPQQNAPKVTAKQVELIKGLYKENEITNMLTRLKVSSLEEITIEQASTMIKARKKG
ncbi:ERF family protein [Methanobrevibacter sp.]|uniref:ERF family protein n=1 Tax=Methanobrevibacter sp. TaxID=66852 RepID=UPI00388F9CE2